MITFNKLHTFLPALALIGLGQLHAQITYVDAVEGESGNTGITGQALSDISWVGADGTSPSDSLWRKRAGFGTGGTAFQALPNGSPASIPQLTTTLSGLADGTYNVWVFFQDNVGDATPPYQNWSISAGLTSGALTTYWGPGQPAAHMSNNIPAGATTQGVANAADLNFTSSPVIAEDSDVSLRNLFGAKLGQVTVSGGSAVEVFVDMLVDGVSSTSRVLYDGVGYELVPPLATPITYVDAVEGASGNTYATGSALADTSWESGTNETSGKEEQWTKLTGLEGNGDTLFQASHTTTDGDQIPELTTEIRGLADGTYAIWAFYWDQTDSNSQNWTLSAGLNSGSLASYRSPDEPSVTGADVNPVENAANLTFANSVVVEAGFNGSVFVRNLFGVYLGKVTVSGGSSTVNVHIDNLLGGGSSNRTWYDGVGYQLLGGVNPTDSFSDWIADYPNVGGNTGVDDDADGDGIDNGVENFFRTDPSAASQGLVSGAVDTVAGTFTFTHPLNATPASDLTATYRWSKDLATFTDDGDPFEGTTVSFAQGTPSGGSVTVTATVTGTPLSKLFVDVQVTQD